MYSTQSGKALFPFIITLFLGLCIYLYLPSSQGEQSNFSGAATQVTAHTVTSEENAVLIEAIGSARANQAIYIRSAQNDYVTDIFCIRYSTYLVIFVFIFLVLGVKVDSRSLHLHT